MPGGFTEKKGGANRSNQKEQDQKRQLVLGHETHAFKVTACHAAGNTPHAQLFCLGGKKPL
jgi:hypothetical protein